MNIKIVLISLILILCTLNIVLIYQFYSLHKKYTDTTLRLESEQKDNRDMSYIAFLKKQEFLSEDSKLSDYMVWDVKDNYDNLSQILTTEERLVLYIDDKHCEACIQHCFDQLEKIFKEKIDQNVILLCNFRNSRHFIAFTQNLKIPIKYIYNLNGQTLNLPIEAVVDKPLFWIMNSELCSRQLFVPIKEINGYTANYLTHILNRYWNTNGE